MKIFEPGWFYLQDLVLCLFQGIPFIKLKHIPSTGLQICLRCLPTEPRGTAISSLLSCCGR